MKSHRQPESPPNMANQSSSRRVGQAHGGMAGRYEAGAVMPMVVVVLVVLISIAGLVVDFAPVFLDKNKLQNAADEAALAAEEYLKNNTSASNDTVIGIARIIFDQHKPDGAASLQDANVTIDRTNAQEPSVRVTVTSTRDTSFIRVLPGADDNPITVNAVGFAKQKVVDAVQACISPMVICSDTDLQASTTKLRLAVGTDVVFLCEDGDKNCTSSLDDRMAKGSYPFGGGVIDPKANGTICYQIPGKSSKGRATGQYRGGLNSRFFNCGISGARPAPGLPSGFSNCTQGASYKRDQVSWTGFKIDSSSANIGNLTYKEFTQISGYRDLWGCTNNWRSASSNCDTSGSSPLVNVTSNTAKDRRTLIVAQVPRAACTSGAVEFDSSKVKVKCAFLRQPVGTNDNDIYIEITSADCGALATNGAGTSRKRTTRLFE